VHLQRARLAEGHVAAVALVRPLVGVRADVHDQARFRVEAMTNKKNRSGDFKI
jgi:hypothetical protein